MLLLVVFNSCEIAKSLAKCLISQMPEMPSAAMQPLSRFAREPNSSNLHQLYQIIKIHTTIMMKKLTYESSARSVRGCF